MGIIVGSVGVTVVLAATLFVWYRRKFLRTALFMQRVAPAKDNYYTSDFQKAKGNTEQDKWELRPGEFEITTTVLGEGAFGKVYLGKVAINKLIDSAKAVSAAIETTTSGLGDVAVKMLHNHATKEARSEFMREMSIMKTLDYHAHIVNLVGCVTHSTEPALVVEYCANGDLLTLVRRHRDCLIAEAQGCKNGDKQCLVQNDLVSFSWQISDGMVYLSSVPIVHRDLAARNVLLTSRMVAKIADFGMCYREDEDNVAKRSKKVPVKWTAPEALRMGTFSMFTDVWSYGVLLYELFSCGEVPYSDIETEKLLEHLESDGRLPQPQICPSEVYRLMQECWTLEPSRRPSFEKIRLALGVLLEQRSHLYGYLDASDYYATIPLDHESEI